MKISKTIIDKIKNIKVSKQNLNRYIKNHYPRIFNSIMTETNFLDNYSNDISIFERLYCIEHGLKSRPLCKVCGVKTVSSFNKQTNTYRLWCSPSCQVSDKECISKSKETRKQLYGNENYNGCEKSRDTRYGRNGGNWHDSEFSKKVKKTKLLNHGCENYTNVEKYRETIRNRIDSDPNFWKERERLSECTKILNGHDPKWNNREKFSDTLKEFSKERKQEIKEKRELTNLERYGYSSTLQVPEFRNISSDYYIDNFSCTCRQQTEEWKKKHENIMLEKYGVKTYLRTKDAIDKRHRKMVEIRYSYLTDNLYDFPMFDIEEFGSFADTKLKMFRFKCKTCGNEFESYVGNHNGIHDRCPLCFKYDCTSVEEKEFSDFIKSSFNGEILENTRKVIPPLELDIYIPSLKLAFEYDGLYWHCDDKKDMNYHLNKTELCESMGIRLIHVFESEWLNSKEIVMSRIKGLLNVFENRIYGRLCDIYELSSEESNDFVKINHIQSSSNASVNIGLKYKNELVSVMTFSKSRISKTYEYELVRFCNKLNTTVIGGASKLLSYFEKMYNPKSIVTYADRRWSCGNLYNILKFNLDHVSRPNYWYFKHGRYVLESRMKYQKHKLKQILPVYDDSKSETENMKMNDYYRIFDCGNYVFVKNYISDCATS